MQPTRVVALIGKGDGLNVIRLRPFAIEQFRISVQVTYTYRLR